MKQDTSEVMHSKTIEQTLKELNTSDKGISEEDAHDRLKDHGLNEITEGKRVSPWEIFFRQFKSIVIWVLIFATGISAFLGEYIDAAVICAIIILIAVLGFVHEYGAEKGIESLKKIVSLKAIVLRGGKKREIDAKQLVPGDVILLETGDKAPADARLIEVFNLKTQEAALTGESIPINQKGR